MKVKIIIDTQKTEADSHNRSLVWEGEMEILDKEEYLVRVSIVGEGQPQPLCQIPFALGIGYYHWFPPDMRVNDDMGDGDYLDELQ